MEALKNLVFSIFLFFSTSSFAQNQNSQEHHRQFNPQHQGYDGSSNSVSQIQRQPNEIWQNKFGAIAYDKAASVIGTSEDENSMSAARRIAIRNCGPSTKCKVAAYARNSCTAIAQDGGITAFGAEPSEAAATQEALGGCREVGGRQCRVTYVHCNVPVRIR